MKDELYLEKYIREVDYHQPLLLENVLSVKFDSSDGCRRIDMVRRDEVKARWPY